LLNNSFGKFFFNLYYKYSPPIADSIANHDSLRANGSLDFIALYRCKLAYSEDRLRPQKHLP